MLFGIPLPIIGFICFIISAVFIFVRPQPKAEAPARGFWTNYILHWFHPLAWVLLAMAAIYQIASPVLSWVLLIIGLLIYVVFILFLINEKKK